MSNPTEAIQKIQELSKLSEVVFSMLKDGAVSSELLNGQINNLIRNKDMLAKELECANQSILDAKKDADKIIDEAQKEADKIIAIARENLNAAIIDRQQAKKELDRAKIQSQVAEPVKI